MIFYIINTQKSTAALSCYVMSLNWKENENVATLGFLQQFPSNFLKV